MYRVLTVKRACLIACFSLFFTVHQAGAQINPDTLQTGQWATAGSFNVNGAQVGLVNWASGGQNAVSLSSLLNFNVFRKLKTGGLENSIELSYGLTNQESSPFGWEKSDDIIQFNSRYYRAIDKKWNYSALLKFRTQFDAGLAKVEGDSLQEGPQRVKVSDFLAPAYANLSIGIEYREDEFFSLMISPLSGKLTVVNDDALAAEAAYGVEPGQKTRFEEGAIISSKLRWVPMENIRIESRLDLFGNYETLRKIDVNFENLIILRANEYISTSITTNLIYDHDVDIQRDNGTLGPDTQFKEVIAVGFLYNF